MKIENDNNKVKKKKSRKLDWQNIFNVISLGFILGCCVFYGSRFIKLYKENNKVVEVEKNTLAQIIKNDNFSEDYFSNIYGEYYYVGDVSNNYIKYSNILWRILKVNTNNELVLVSDKPLTNLAFNPNSTDFVSSDINKWLNKSDSENTGILEGQLNNVSNYLSKSKTCITTVDNVKNNKCKDYYSDGYIGILSIEDYVNSGGDKSYINNDTNFYLSNFNKDKDVWFVNDSKKLDVSSKDDLFGVKAVITLKNSIELMSGNGTKDNPYKFEKENGLFGSFVKIDDDIWQIYQVNENDVNLVLNNYIFYDNVELLKYYSQLDYKYNIKSSTSLAYYLNNNYLRNLKYSSIINNNTWKNVNYDLDNENIYNEIFTSVVTAKVGLLSIGDIFINSDINDFNLMSGKYGLIYNYYNNGTLKGMNITTKNHVIPTININKSYINTGDGSFDNPYVINY